MPTDSDARQRPRDMPGMLMAVVFILIAAGALWDTTNMSDSDSYVFPSAVAIAMIVFSIALIVWNLVYPSGGDVQAVPGASTSRRVALVAAMLISTALMPFVGFLISGVAAFAAIMMIAMYDPWTRYRKIVYPLVCVGVVLGFYMIFAKVLLVPLPAGLLFE
ncbi:MAG: tripartite tricarboxylate transporter TctB family protein [Sedimenticolaceae bacterium]